MKRICSVLAETAVSLVHWVRRDAAAPRQAHQNHGFSPLAVVVALRVSDYRRAALLSGFAFPDLLLHASFTSSSDGVAAAAQTEWTRDAIGVTPT